MNIFENWKEDFRELGINMKFEFLKDIRQKRITILAIISLILPFLFYIVPIVSGNDLPDKVDSFLPNIMSFTYLITVLNAIFFGADSINSERYTKTALLIYPLPQRRTSIFVAKYLTQLLVSWGMIVLYYGVTATIIYFVYGPESITEDMLKSIFFAFLYMTTMLSIAIFLSSIVKNPAASMMFTFFLVFMLFPITSMILGSIDVDTTWIVTNYSGLISKIYRFPVEIFAPGGNPEDLDFYKGVWLNILYSGVLGSLSWYFTMKQEVS